MLRLFHVSDRANIERFDPRPALNNPVEYGDVVWAVDEKHLPNYLLPRGCPRICFAASNATTERDRVRFLEHSTASRVIAIEWDWLEIVRATTLYLYELPPRNFQLQDDNAGYYVSQTSVEPSSIRAISDLLLELWKSDVELRLIPRLWELHDVIAKSSLEFSMIRMRNAKPR